jgi:uncharacterized phage protein (TIGR01671 family)
MRVLKFRAWDKVKKEWIFHTNENPFHIIGEVTVFDMLGQYSVSQFNDIEITQYTGLQDSKGKEIYEGDVVEYIDDRDIKKKRLVFYEYGGFLPFADNDDGIPYPKPYECEIIGNIYENPEL